MRPLFLLLALLWLGPLALPNHACTSVRAQKVMLFEKLKNSKAERLYEGDRLRFRIRGDKFWQEGFIREMRPDIQALVINDRFILLEEIDLVDRGSSFGKAAGYSLMTFGVAWTGIGLIGYNTDKDSNTQISGGELATGAASFVLGYALVKLLGQKKFRPGKYKRLRIVDTTF
ncbi:hypothetical protein [Neolewinella antarctica]|uniref:Uncharacterized protein n=1 Tax=Neolewinella antarctica TaxID=442734 RepID=A0ABX0XFC7_9BACT|nr:hypothetical protein [Neolewinella antarctica]NJC27483.1 hypothetical protein [Neolewinella antarctica]